MKRLLREIIRKEIKKILESYDPDDIMLSDLGMFSNIKKRRKNQYKDTESPDESQDEYADSSDLNEKEPESQIEITDPNLLSISKFYSQKYPSPYDSQTIVILSNPEIYESITLSDDELDLYKYFYEMGKNKINSTISSINTEFDSHTKNAIETASQLEGIPKYVLYSFAAIETGGDVTLRDDCNTSGYCGLFQFGDSAAQLTGFSSKDDLYSDDPDYNKILNNAIAACRYMKKHSMQGAAQHLGKNSLLTLFLSHNQGSAGSESLFNDVVNKNNDNQLNNNQLNNVISGDQRITGSRSFLISWWGYLDGLEYQSQIVSLPQGNVIPPTN